MVLDIAVWALFVLGAVAFVGVVGKGLVGRLRHRPPEQWQDDPPEGAARLRGGPTSPGSFQ